MALFESGGHAEGLRSHRAPGGGVREPRVEAERRPGAEEAGERALDKGRMSFPGG